MFTPAEKRYIPYIAMPTKVACAALKVHESSIKAYTRSICGKLNVRNKSSAIVRLTQMGYVIKVWWL